MTMKVIAIANQHIVQRVQQATQTGAD